MGRTVTSAELKAMSPRLQEQRMGDLVRSAQRPVNGEVEKIESAVEVFERQHSMTSAEMQRRVHSGTLPETKDVCRWLMLLELRDRLVKRRARPK